jgi:hypothetical protein
MSVWIQKHSIGKQGFVTLDIRTEHDRVQQRLLDYRWMTNAVYDACYNAVGGLQLKDEYIVCASPNSLKYSGEFT